MDFFQYRNQTLFCEDMSVDTLAERFGTPLYVYSQRTLEHHYDALAKAFAPLDPIICYAIKSCSNVHLCRLLAKKDAGMDVVSGGELFRAQQAGADMKKVVYAGVGKTDSEIAAAIEAGIGWFNVESEAEFENIAAIAQRLNKTARAALRINPDVDPQTAHAKTTTGKKETKFGVDIDRARRFFAAYSADSHLQLSAIHMHIGSPVYKTQPYADAITKALTLVGELNQNRRQVTAINIGGGFGADYETGQSPQYDAYASAIVPLLQPFKDAGGRIILEPGRTLVANAGLLLARVQYIKQGGRKKFIIIDSGMHQLIRPTLYESFHFIWPVKVDAKHVPATRGKKMDLPGLESADVVGPICETGDYLALDRDLPPMKRGDLLAVFGAGAYGMSMASNYNTMPRPAEVLVNGDQATVIRRRETYEDLVALETA